MEELRSLDYILLMSGCKIMPCGRVIRFLNNLMFLSVLAVQLILTATYAHSSEMDGYSLIFIVTYYLPFYAYGVVFLVIMRMKRRSQQAFLILIISGMSSERRKTLRRLSLTYSVIILIFTALTFASSLESSISYQMRESENTLEITLFYLDSYCYVTRAPVSRRRSPPESCKQESPAQDL